METNLLCQLELFIRERESIRKKKEAKEPWPWTNDTILQKYKFTNVWRQDDSVTKAIHVILNHIKGTTMNDDGTVILNIFLLRLINNVKQIENVSLVEYGEAKNWKEDALKYGDAFIILPALSKGTKKIDEIKRLLIQVEKKIQDGRSVKECFTHPRISGLIQYEMMCDWWQYADLPETYCYIGIGAKSMLQKICRRSLVTEDDITELTNVFNTVGITHEKYGAMTPRCTEGMLCEFRKYTNLITNPNARKRIYRK